MSVEQSSSEGVAAVFHFLYPGSTQHGAYSLTGKYELNGRVLRFKPAGWLHQSAGKVVPVAAVCCGEDTCSDLKFSVTIEAWTGPSPGVDAHVQCTGEDACEDSEWTVAPGHNLTVFCDGTSDTCDDAKFIVEGSETAVCNGPGCSNAETISRRVM